MAQVRLRTGRIFFTLLVIAGIAGWLTWPRWRDRLEGTPLQDAPALVSRGVDWLRERFGGLRRERGIERTAAMLPSDTAGLMVVRGFEGLYRKMLSTDRLKPETREELRQWGLSELGIDLTDPQAIAATGFDFSKPWTVAGVRLVRTREADMVVFIPVSDGAAAVATVRSVLRKNGLEAQERSAGGFTAYVVDGRVAFTTHDDQLLVTSANLVGYDPVSALRARLEQTRAGSLAEREGFHEVLEAQGKDWQLFGYVAPSVVQDLFSGSGSGLARSMSAKGGGFSFHADDQRLRFRTTLLDAASGALLREGGDDRLAERIEGTALAAGRASFDLDQLWSRLNETPEGRTEVESTVNRVRQEVGIDLKTDVIDNLDGRFAGVVLSQPSSGALADTALGRLFQAARTQQASEALPFGVVAWAGVKRMEEARAVLDRTAERVRGNLSVTIEHEGGEHWYYTELGGVGLARDHLIGFFGRGRREALRSSLAGKGTSYLEAFPRPVRRELLGGSPGYFYLDVKNTATAVNQLPFLNGVVNPGAREAREAIEATFTGFSIATEQHRDAINTDYELHGPEAGFSSVQGLLEEKARRLQVTP